MARTWDSEFLFTEKVLTGGPEVSCDQEKYVCSLYICLYIHALPVRNRKPFLHLEDISSTGLAKPLLCGLRNKS
jgi:hypothetical protein